MPRLSDTMAEGTIVSWNKKVGDKVKPGDVLAEVETDKATMELESYNEGTLLYIGVDKGKAAKVDGVIAIIGKEGEDYKSALAAAGDMGNEATEQPLKKENQEKSKEPVAAAPSTGSKATLPAGAKEIRMPLLSDTMTEGKIVTWNKKVGDPVKADDVLAEVETDKATMEVVGYEEGTLLYIGIESGKAARINELIAIVGKPGTDVSAYVSAEKNNSAATVQTTKESTGKTEPAPAVTASPEATTLPPGEEKNDRIKASPLAKKLAADKGIDISTINGSGDGGRITKKDITDYTPGAQQRRPESNIPVPAFAETGKEGFTDEPVSQMRKIIARRLGESKFSAPHFYLTMEINMDNAIASRNEMNEVSPVKISFNDLLIKACAAALRLHPAVNSSWMGDFIRHNHHIHIGSAVAIPEGLIVPVIRFADQKSLSQIALEAKQLYTKAKEKKLQPNEFTGNTFTISNLGMMDIEEFTAIINPPDSCILAVGKIKEIVVKKGNGFDTTNVMKLTLSCDHRSVDGSVGAAFLQTLKRFIENPVTILV